ncbi:GNAT family N-acetyltransferase [Aquimarina hainanensis]|uniref:GNAT family N-acetyltransferase n=1 Tax=Aquimarina hainanensis TaxID=1578017 RepID=A0ABW5N5U1_9FLAO|nr:GNAT family N-acetyltransferase [Aquimarina sp. TRL1]QKX04325.1 GNAT family N-acetyltransferase [Aquimarina sp. TRL1]
MNITISTDKNLLDVDCIHQFLTHSYWARGRTKKEVALSIEHSLNFGMYLDQEQIGYARVVTDFILFGYLLDVFIIEEHRGKGYAKMLIRHILQYKTVNNVQKWMLNTKDAQGLYKKFGFVPYENPTSTMMQKTSKPPII